VHDLAHTAELQSGAAEQQVDPLEDRHGRVGGRGQLLVDGERAPFSDKREIRERPPDVDTDPDHSMGARCVVWRGGL
jgi:hypothetical protein